MYSNEGISQIEDTQVLKLDPFIKMGKPAAIVKLFGGKAGYLKAVKELEEEEIVSPVKSSGTNGNYRYPLYKKYHIHNREQTDETIIRGIRGLHPRVQGGGYLIKHPEIYEEHWEDLNKLST